MSRTKYLLTTVCTLLLFFAVGRIGFIMNNAFVSPCSVWEYAVSLLFGIPQDLVVIFWMMAIPAFVAVLSLTRPNLKVRRWLVPYFVFACLVITLIVVADGMMYEHWKFKLDNCIFSYASSPEGAASSVSILYLIGVASVLVGAYTLCLGSCLFCIPKRFTPSELVHNPKEKSKMGMRIGLGTMCVGLAANMVSVGTSYWSDTLLLNHISTNSVFNLAASFRHDQKSYNKQFAYFSNTEATQIVSELYPTNELETTAIEDTLLNTQTPNILFIQLESCGAVFVEALGGAKESSPNLSRYAEEGILFDNVYANSFRTDRGTVSALSGYVSYPTASLMLMPKTLDKLPSLAHSLAAKGYTTDYQYGGVIANMGKENYLRHAGFQTLTSAADYTFAAGEATAWGASDSLSFCRIFDIMMEREQSGKPWLVAHQTIDSHEPWTVPYHACDNPILNAFAYTDHHMGLLIERLKESPLWDNLLIVIYSDHGYLYNQTYQDPEFFHIPVVWTGGAVKQPRRIHTLMNQSDMMPTLLAQLGISRQGFPWGRDVMTQAYQQHPFAYCTFPAGILFMDATGTTIYDIHAQKAIFESESESSTLRQQKAKAILQKSYDELQKLSR